MIKYFPIIILFLAAGCACCRQTFHVRDIEPGDFFRQKIDSNTFIEISIEGGGIYGGINPTTKNRKVIRTDGGITVTKEQLHTGGKVETFFTTRAEVEELARFIRDNGFFGLNGIYDCSESNSECQGRKKKYPRPVPLEIEVTIGDLKKKVIVTVYEKGMIDYPDNLEVIVNQVSRVIDQARQ
ncbi:MAG: hypothetical protein AMJ91_03675 [candidate division Zixibacteria bacterium SM23_73_3]|nr:MAG: hypothetical protein AMJ91_03675 [candidate division Zixibacteria bacterium SM23_73_3]